ncbi:hypothetical protein I4U23_012350 [Adineta vaga]|nr:hypothetical protein I4U23_012350 [Adineta vaga]
MFGHKFPSIVKHELADNNDIISGEYAELLNNHYDDVNKSIRVKYKLSHDGYRRYYTNSFRVKLSRFLYDSCSRKERSQIVQRDAAATDEIPRDPDFMVMNTQNSYPYSETFAVEHKDQ